MSSWDVILIAILCLAIFRGYFKGLCRRFTDWVGLVLAAFLAGFNITMPSSKRPFMWMDATASAHGSKVTLPLAWRPTQTTNSKASRNGWPISSYQTK